MCHQYPRFSIPTLSNLFRFAYSSRESADHYSFLRPTFGPHEPSPKEMDRCATSYSGVGTFATLAVPVPKCFPIRGNDDFFIPALRIPPHQILAAIVHLDGAREAIKPINNRSFQIVFGILVYPRWDERTNNPAKRRCLQEFPRSREQAILKVPREDADSSQILVR